MEGFRDNPYSHPAPKSNSLKRETLKKTLKKFERKLTLHNGWLLAALMGVVGWENSALFKGQFAENLTILH